MPTFRPAFATLLYLLVAASTLMAAQGDDNGNSITSVPRWQPQDFAFTNAVVVDNPFKVQFTAEVSGPNSIKLVTDGVVVGGGAVVSGELHAPVQALSSCYFCDFCFFKLRPGAEQGGDAEGVVFFCTRLGGRGVKQPALECFEGIAKDHCAICYRREGLGLLPLKFFQISQSQFGDAD